MTRIDQSYIEELWQRFLDCQLSETEEAELMAYLESNPDVMAMLEASDAEDVKFEKKELLSVESITERLLIEKVEGVISEEDERYIDAEIESTPDVRKSYEAYLQTLQKPNLNIHYPDKDSLKKRGIVFWLRPVSIAATFAIIATSAILLYKYIGNGEKPKIDTGEPNDGVTVATQGELYVHDKTEDNIQEIIPKNPVSQNYHTPKNTNSYTNETLAQNTDTTTPATTPFTSDIAINALDSISQEPIAQNVEVEEINAEQGPVPTDTTDNINSTTDITPEELYANQSQDNGVTIVKDNEFRKFLRRRASEIRNNFREDKTIRRIKEIGDEITLAFINSKK
ncbi:MAG: hypothetical protein IIU33_07410 [Bacteroidales bacterium]|nr:hypothetical protein [Bacteroidales bacterium]